MHLELPENTTSVPLSLRKPNRRHRAYKWYKLKIGKRKHLARMRRPRPTKKL